MKAPSKTFVSYSQYGCGVETVLLKGDTELGVAVRVYMSRGADAGPVELIFDAAVVRRLFEAISIALES